MFDQTLIVTVIAAAIIFGGGLFIVFRKQEGGWGPRNIQALGLVLLLPTILTLAGMGKIDNSVLATLLGALAGYILSGRFGGKDD
jgi:hypothetical protein